MLGIGRLRQRSEKGFTLLEILIVIVILGVLAALAIPIYENAVERSRVQEALRALTSAREAMLRYFAGNETYEGAEMPDDGTRGPLDFNPNVVPGGQVRIFEYDLTDVTADGFLIMAIIAKKCCLLLKINAYWIFFVI